MNLYVYGLKTDFTDVQKARLRQKFAKVEFYKKADYAPLFQDTEPKVIALDPDPGGVCRMT